MNSSVLIYSKEVCPYCVKAKNLFLKLGVSFKEIDVSQNHAFKEEMIKKSGGRMTVPQIFINDFHVGGCDDLYALHQAGKLTPLLNNKEHKK